jgi:hypothetical protein
MSIFLGGSFSERFLHAALGRIVTRLEAIYAESNGKCKRLPVGMFFVIDKENGGNDVCDEIVRRFRLLGAASKSYMDFYYLGWVDYDYINQVDKDDGSLYFCMSDFDAIKEAFRKEYRIRCFNGYADLLLVDVELDDTGTHNKVYFNFQDAVSIDMSKAIKSGDIPSLGEFMERLIEAAASFRSENDQGSSVAFISDTLGIMYAKENVIRYVFKKWGEIVGANSLKHLATSGLGSRMEIVNYYNT